ncbi:MAG: SPASM domain-containing protein, partial [Nitrososphaerota archaeon]|nr:SPASM domain-containing protein [Nitrososphaerota archaeon]
DSHVVKIGSVYAGFDEAQKEWEAKWLKVPPYCEAPKKCLSCSFKKACSGGCIAMNYDILGTVHAIPDTFCTIKQIITSTLEDLCKSLQNNKTFSNLYNSRNNVYQQGLSVVACQANNNLCSCQNKPTGQLKTNNSANTQTS